MPIGFQKMNANGDDFVIVDLRGQDQDRVHRIDRDLVRRMGDRRCGIGFNQLAVMSDCDDAAARVAFRNPDGSTLDTCGSATRGVAWKLMRETGAASVVLRTNRGRLRCSHDAQGLIKVEMGAPRIGWQDIPTAEEADTLALPLPGAPSACSMGNPHCTFFVDDADAVDLETFGPSIETHPLFPQRTNVHVVQVVSRSHIRLRIWERGGGVPLGSGSCSCGAAVNGIRRGLLDDTVRVTCDGGDVAVQWDGTGSVFLSGPVAFGFSGVWPS
ncbi:TPA: diaminopimelate epimerase [Burkholderia aenigmatica]|uniref:diaminopimelate epimerase n=1 Tax=Burkholderia sp. AU45251 TaxID=3059204 RepID=UPI00264DE1A8|nr:diaminopimelate epimerase [Burkholderia sp. AU45251]HDR9485226.1 diaminopimelate epimerase [Burkholderia aenigmatica]MDN7515536.1 diaminopimelate epimerase [Burkholderia sp. AU45251]HDR9516773.1 diaminopimelate epimerase [Burkholderia aenigmatica]HDR9593833.1 diaminopimelate epimerase [Burkholderia aenigmatica]HDR9602139.1 diaminopimelate epimerase [Burkholderia aenigmatica]